MSIEIMEIINLNNRTLRFIVVIIIIIFSSEVFAVSCSPKDELTQKIDNNFGVNLPNSYKLTLENKDDDFNLCTYIIMLDDKSFDLLMKDINFNGWIHPKKDYYAKEKTLNKSSFLLEVSVQKKQIILYESQYDNLFGKIGVNSDAFVFQFIDSLKNDIKNNKIYEISKKVYYPLNIYKHHDNKSTLFKTVKNENQFIKEYDSIFSEKLKTAILDSTLDDLLINGQGFSLGRGVIWISYLRSDYYANESKLLINSINIQQSSK